LHTAIDLEIGFETAFEPVEKPVLAETVGELASIATPSGWSGGSGPQRVAEAVDQ
jgi:hypothetical protein